MNTIRHMTIRHEPRVFVRAKSKKSKVPQK